jgi:BON domain
MLLETLSRIVPEDPALRLQRHIDLRTGGRIRNLQVTVADDRVTITGLAPSYYAKQLALQAARESLGQAAGVALDIDVVASAAPAAEGHDG